MWHKPCRTFHPWCPCIKTRCLLYLYVGTASTLRCKFRYPMLRRGPNLVIIMPEDVGGPQCRSSRGTVLITKLDIDSFKFLCVSRISCCNWLIRWRRFNGNTKEDFTCDGWLWSFSTPHKTLWCTAFFQYAIKGQCRIWIRYGPYHGDGTFTETDLYWLHKTDHTHNKPSTSSMAKHQ